MAIKITTKRWSGKEFGLRDMIAYAANNPGDDTITFAANLSGNTIILTTPITVNDTSGNLTIVGLGTTNLTISGGGNVGIDVARTFVREPEKIYTWWSYRAADWQAMNKGRRLDHIWVTPPLAGAVSKHQILREARGWDRPSDHVPVMTTIKL